MTDKPLPEPVPLSSTFPRWWALKLLAAANDKDPIKAIDAVTDEMVRAGLCRPRDELREWRYGQIV